MEELKEKLNKVFRKYCPLQKLNPEDELLKYFILNDNGFRHNRDKEIKVEFLEKFRGDFPKINDLKEGRVEMSFKEYNHGLMSSLLQNYCNALEREIEYIKLNLMN